MAQMVFSGVTEKNGRNKMKNFIKKILVLGLTATLFTCGLTACKVNKIYFTPSSFFFNSILFSFFIFFISSFDSNFFNNYSYL